jgi:hypothetical protein
MWRVGLKKQTMPFVHGEGMVSSEQATQPLCHSIKCLALYVLMGTIQRLLAHLSFLLANSCTSHSLSWCGTVLNVPGSRTQGCCWVNMVHSKRRSGFDGYSC